MGPAIGLLAVLAAALTAEGLLSGGAKVMSSRYQDLPQHFLPGWNSASARFAREISPSGTRALSPGRRSSEPGNPPSYILRTGFT